MASASRDEETARACFECCRIMLDAIPRAKPQLTGPARVPSTTDDDMNAAARQTLRELRSLGNIQTYLRTAKAELASNPCDERLRAFIEVVEGLQRRKRSWWPPDG
jgi:hypothetical protein